MSTPVSAFPIAVKVAPDSSGSAGSYAAVAGVNKADFGAKNTLVDATYFTSAGATARFPTLADTDITISGHYTAPGSSSNPSSDTAQNTVMLSTLPTTADRFIWVQFFWDGSTHGPSLKCVVDGFKISASTAGVLEYSFTIKGSGIVTYS